MGADAARFLQVDTNFAPVITLSDSALQVLTGTEITLTASASDSEDGDLTSALQWTDGGVNSAIGASFVLTPGLGSHAVTASVTDSEGSTTQAMVTIYVVADDNDGLTPAEEALLGTNPADADTDDDGLIDGDEVNTHSTHPLSADSDGDTLPDGYEVANGLDANNATDAASDPDADGFSNLEEFQNGTDPQVANLPQPANIILDNGDAGTSSTGGTFTSYDADQQYGSSALYAATGGSVDIYRFTPNMDQAGNYQVFAWNSCYTNRSTNVPHTIVHAGGSTSVAVDQDCDTGSAGEWFDLGVYYFDIGTAGYVEISDDGLGGATFIGADAMRFQQVDTNNAPVVTPSTTQVQLVVGDTANLTASATDAEDGDLTVSLSWASTDGTNGSGAAFALTPALGNYSISVSVTDLDGASTSIDINVLVVASSDDFDDDNDGLSNGAEAVAGTLPDNPDTDTDGLSDGDEVNTHNTNPLAADTDSDGMNDAFEVQYNLDANNSSDANLDADGDGLTNLEEHDAGSNPTVAAVTEIILVNGDTGTSSNGTWSTFAGNESYNGSSLWAEVGGVVDRYRFTPEIEVGGTYDI